MRKTFGGIKHHWRPVYNQSANASGSSSSFGTVLDISGKGKVAVTSGNNSWIASNIEVEVYVDGTTTYIFQCLGNKHYIQCEFHFNTAIRVRHKVASGTCRTHIAYWRI